MIALRKLEKERSSCENSCILWHVHTMSSFKNLPEPQIIQMYSDGYSLRELAILFLVDRGVIKKRLQSNGIELRSLSEANRIYSFDENTFEKVNSHDKAYWLGFIASDGSIYENALKIGLSFKDFAHLEKFRAFMKSTHPIHTYFPILKGKTYKSCEISLRSDKLIQDLAKLNLSNNKSKTLTPSKIENKYLNSYILGIIDGDGCFHVDKKGQMKLNVISSLLMCQFIMATLVKNCDITQTKIVAEKRSPGMHYCYFGGNTKIRSITDFLYRDAQVWLDRKRTIVKDHFGG
jgi:hypothetical protein